MKNSLGVIVVAVCVLLPLSSVAQNQRSDNDRGPNQGYGVSHDRWQERLSAEDQGRFDSYYSRWLTARRTGDRHETGSMEERMREVMTDHNIPNGASYEDVMQMLSRHDRN